MNARRDLQGGYDPAHFAQLAAVEDSHFWFRARNLIISRIAAGIAAGFGPPYKVLEMGCGNGNVLRFLEKACSGATAIGMDLYGEGLAFARGRVASPLIQGDVRCAPFATAFELIGMFDVLEHISDDLAILKHTKTLLAPNGRLLLTVPAHQFLWSDFDVAAGHCRRYECGALREKLEATGYEVEFLSEYMMALYPLMWLSRKTGRQRENPQDTVERNLKVVPVVNSVMLAALEWEAAWLANRRRLPAGSSIVAIARLAA